jgi:hypothetical protein
MDTRFCVHYKGDGYAPSNRYCRECPKAHAACDALWARVVGLSLSGNGAAVMLAGTRAAMYPYLRNRNFVRLKINCCWNLPKEDFLYFIATGHAGMGRKGHRDDPKSSPSMTRQEPYVQAIAAALGGDECTEIRDVRRVQKGLRSISGT